MYKKIIFIAVALILSACSKEESSNSDISINPPSWLIGTWLVDESNFGFKFTSNDVVSISSGIEISQREQVLFIINAGGEASAYDESSSDTYKLVLNFVAGQTVIYNFTKISENEIEWSSAPYSIYIKQ